MKSKGKLYRVTIPTPDEQATFSALVYENVKYGEEWGYDIINKYKSEEVIPEQENRSEQFWKWVKSKK